MDTFFQRTIPQMAVKTGGAITVTSNTEPLGHLKLVSGASLMVSSGGVVRDITNSGGTAIIASGGSAIIDSGFTAEGITVIERGDGGLRTTAGILKSCTIDSNGEIFASSAVIEDCVVSSGHLQLYGTAVVSNLSAYAGFVNLFTSGAMLVEDSFFGGTVTVAAKYDCHLLSNITVAGTVNLHIYNQGQAVDVSISGGNTSVYSGGALSNCQIISSGTIKVFSGGIIENCSAGQGYIQLATDASGSNVQLSISARGHVKQGAILSGGSVEGSGTYPCLWNVSSGGTLCQVNAGPMGKIYMSASAVISDCIASGSGAALTIVSSSHTGSLIKDCAGVDSGCIYIRGNGIAGSNLVVSGTVDTQLYIWQPAAGETVSAVNCSTFGGRINVRSGGVLSSAYVAEAGQCIVSAGGYAETVDVVAATAYVSSAGSVCTGTCIGSDTTAGTFQVWAGGYLQSTNAGPNGKIYVYQSGAIVSNCIASGSGAVISIVSSTYLGNLIKDCTAMTSGCIYIRGNGIAGSNLMASGNVSTRIYIQNPSAGTTVSAVNCSAVSRGRIYVSGGGVLSSGYTAVSGVIFAAKPKAVVDTVQMNGGYISALSGGACRNINISPGIVRIIGYNTSPTVISNVHMGGNGTCDFFMNQNATDAASKGSCIAYDVFISSGKSGSGLIKSGAVVSGITVDDNTLKVLGGTVYLNSAGTRATISVGQGGSMGVHSAAGIIKGTVTLYAGYVESNTVISGGGVQLLYDYSDLASTVQAPSIANQMSIGQGGSMTIGQSCTASTVYVDSGGTLTVSSGGTADDVVLNAGGVVDSQAGAVVNYR